MRNRQLVQPPAFVFAERRLQVHCDHELARRFRERQSRSVRRSASELLHRPRDPFPCVQLSDAQPEPNADPDSKPNPHAESQPESDAQSQSHPHPTPSSKPRSAPNPNAESARQSDAQSQSHPKPNLHLFALAFAAPNAISTAVATLLPTALADTVAARIAVTIAAAVAIQIQIEIANASPQSHRAGLRADSFVPSDAYDESGLPRHGLFNTKEGHHRGQLASLKDACGEEELVRVRCRQQWKAGAHCVLFAAIGERAFCDRLNGFLPVD